MQRAKYSVDVIICIHNSLDDVKRCYQSVKSTVYTGGNVGVILVDDGSDGPTRDYLRSIESENPNVTLIRRESAGGYTVAANTGLRASNAKYCALLNSDTIVPKIWLTKIVDIFEKAPDIAIVGPLSNAASWQSVPERTSSTGGWAVNELPANFTVDTMDRQVEKASEQVAAVVRTPLVNGFCFVIRRTALEEIGFMDEVSFPRGFGEEDDFCMRTINAGYGIAIAVNTYVFHAKSKSYGSAARNELTKKGQIMLKKKHGERRLGRAVQTMRNNPYLAEMRAALSHLVSAQTHPTQD